MEYLERAGVRRRRAVDIWQPQPKQAQLLTACGLLDALHGGEVHPPVCETIGYGGAAYGGKTEGLLGLGLVACLSVPGVKIGYFRRTYPELEGSDGPIERSQDLYRQAGGRYNQGRHVWTFGGEEADEDWTAGSSAAMRFCHCQHEGDVYSYQSAAFDILLIDEATLFTWFIVDYLITRNRRSKFSALPRPFRVFTANPGGPGHLWYMQLFGINPDEDLYAAETLPDA